MSVEKMFMIDLVGHMEELDKVIEMTVLSKVFHPVNALQEIDSTNFTLSTKESNVDALIDVCYIRPYTKSVDFSVEDKIMKNLKTVCLDSKKVCIKSENLILEADALTNSIDDLNEKFKALYEESEKKKKEKEQLLKFSEGMKFLENIDIPFEQMQNLKNFDLNVYKVSRENILKLKSNYENIPAIVISIYTEKEYEIVLSFTPKILIRESERIFKSLNCERMDLSGGNKGTPKEISLLIKEQVIRLEKEMRDLDNKFVNFSKENEEKIMEIYTSVQLKIKCEELKNYIAVTKDFFYLCGWVPESFVHKFEGNLENTSKSTLLIKKDAKEINNDNIKPPTKLHNNAFVRPFEAMVNMYGTPTYGELDPTNFLGISYMIMFGAMFGDVGQGLVFLVAGLFLKYKNKRTNLGGILSRLGVSSMIFGTLYGSVFGFESIIPALLVRPMEDIQDVLLTAIAFGCGLLIIGFIYSLINHINRKDFENGMFSKEGLAGLLFYLSLLIFTVTKITKTASLPSSVWIVIFVLLLLVMLLKQPLANLILNKRPLFSDNKKDYFIEGSFGVLETLLSMFSNTMSFIRVGAFALNHVGLFIAFASLAKMMKGNVSSTIIYLIGNLIIIGLEGLIVFIQGLRLQYYELFSKYYEGAGIAFEGIGISSALEIKTRLNEKINDIN